LLARDLKNENREKQNEADDKLHTRRKRLMKSHGRYNTGSLSAKRLNKTRRQLPVGEKIGLVLPNVSPPQSIGRAVEMSSECFDLANVVACGSLRVMTTLEFLQHDFS
jgi:hypothetical protein